MAAILESYSYVQLFFLSNTALFAVMLLYSLLTGKYWDMKQMVHGIPDQIGLLQFRKRPGLIYFLGIVISLKMLWVITSSYYFGSTAGYYFSHLHQFLFSPSEPSVDGTSVLIAVAVWLLARIYRYHIAVNVSVHSRRQAFNVGQGFGMYACVVLEQFSLLAEAPEFELQPDLLSLSSLRVWHIVGVVLLLFATKLHGDTHYALIKLRKNRFGHITTTDYKMPKGGWFDVVACPHYFAEILTFVAMGTILCFRSYTWWTITAFVVVNQILAAMETHRFYCQKFEDYNKNKKMIIPYLL